MKPLNNKANTDALCVLFARNADETRTGKFREYVAFGDWTDEIRGPSVRFHGGTPFSRQLYNAPIMYFNIYGDCMIAQAVWMNEHNCPNAFDEDFVRQIIYFVQTNLPILYLVYERYLDKEDARAYFEGRMAWENMIALVHGIPEALYVGLLACEDNAQLHTFCVGEQIYGNQKLEPGRPLLCETLKFRNTRIFETEFQGENVVLIRYNGRSAIVRIPEYIDADAFSGHKEIKKLILPESIQFIGAGAFSGCSGIEMLIIPASVWDVSDRAFTQCTQLRSVHVEIQPDHEILLGEDAFCGCTNLKEIFLPESVLIEGHPFANCPQLHIVCAAGSDVEKYARNNGIPYSVEH